MDQALVIYGMFAFAGFLFGFFPSFVIAGLSKQITITRVPLGPAICFVTYIVALQVQVDQVQSIPLVHKWGLFITVMALAILGQYLSYKALQNALSGE
ncbi:hypothetical protein C0580_01200 [Candidatus Parcubacteria bacterium]|nr:MAG: hypothetical protein C0580_01200 [Candidatus Parcubacteria bacterium]